MIGRLSRPYSSDRLPTRSGPPCGRARNSVPRRLLRFHVEPTSAAVRSSWPAPRASARVPEKATGPGPDSHGLRESGSLPASGSVHALLPEWVIIAVGIRRHLPCRARPGLAARYPRPAHPGRGPSGYVPSRGRSGPASPGAGGAWIPSWPGRPRPRPRRRGRPPPDAAPRPPGGSSTGRG